jgi:hypothetical protein
VCDITDQAEHYHNLSLGATALTSHLTSYSVRKLVLFNYKMAFHPNCIICLRYNSSVKYNLLALEWHISGPQNTFMFELLIVCFTTYFSLFFYYKTTLNSLMNMKVRIPYLVVG